MKASTEQKLKLEKSMAQLLKGVESSCKVIIKSSDREVEELEEIILKRLEEHNPSWARDSTVEHFLKQKIEELKKDKVEKEKLLIEILSFTKKMHIAAADVLSELILVAVSHKLFNEEQCNRVKKIFADHDKEFDHIKGLSPTSTNKLIKILTTLPDFMKMD